MENIWLIPGIPLFSFFIVGFLIRPFSRKAAGIAASSAIFISALIVYSVAWDYYQIFSQTGAYPVVIPWTVEWLHYQEDLSVYVGVLLDPTSLLLMIVVTTVSALVHLYSIGYMHGDDGYGRYFTYLNLFTFSMLGLVAAPNIMQMFVCWELVGVSSFLLIGFYYQKPSAVAASKKAFVVTRFADLGFLLGILILGYYGFLIFGEFDGVALSGIADQSRLQPFDFQFLNHPQVLAKFSEQGELFGGISLLTLAMVLIFAGAAGKSAMFPLHIWLPDAMEGPTPVSALIHAATMVVAGVYLVARLFPAFAASGTALLVVAYVGAFTCLFAALIGCTQDDIKRVLAFSTLSQLGYMMLALGVSTMASPLGYTASLFHLFTHAFFKALLFLCAGSVIHAVHSNEIWDMGGLARKMPVTHLTFLIATVAIAGLPPFSGFFSKDEILAAALGNQHPVIFLVGMLVAGMTAFYMFRIYFVTFWGHARSQGAEKAHESPPVMLVPLLILAVLAVVAGFVPMGSLISIGQASEHHGINWAIAIPAVLVALVGIGAAWLLYAGKPERVSALVRLWGNLYILVKHKFYVDELYLFLTHKVIFRFISRPIAWFDRHVVDGGVNLSGWSTRKFGAVLSLLQTGQVQSYGSWYVLSAAFFGLLLWMMFSGS
ncbi:MAG: NADH-quinone oxidoreductase subunit L [SAR324 cluster bacterium]|nr:NADH-quinone oxidoreductase subunit L [SAR324 cluster bacterium]